MIKYILNIYKNIQINFINKILKKLKRKVAG